MKRELLGDGALSSFERVSNYLYSSFYPNTSHKRVLVVPEYWTENNPREEKWSTSIHSLREGPSWWGHGSRNRGQLLTLRPQSGSRGGGMLMFRILVFYSVWNPSPWMELPTFGEVLHPEVSSLNHTHRLAQSCLNPVKLTVKINLFFFIWIRLGKE